MQKTNVFKVSLQNTWSKKKTLSYRKFTFLESIYVNHHSLENYTIMFTYVIDCKSQLKSA